MHFVKRMKAAKIYRPGDLQLEESDLPKPEEGELLLKVRACGICASDLKILSGDFPGIKYPIVPGHELSGEVVALGPRVQGFELKDRIAVEPHSGCGQCTNCMKGEYTACLNYGKMGKSIGQTANGGFAEFCAVPIRCAHKFPETISFDEAALVSNAGTSLHGLERAGVEPGDTVVVFGPGAIGLTAVQAAKSIGAAEVISIGREKDVFRLDLAKKLGADVMINADREDPLKRILELTSNRGADLAVEATGAIDVANQAIAVVRRRGRVLILSNYGANRNGTINLSKVMLDSIDMIGSRGSAKWSCERALKLIKEGKMDLRPLVTQTYSLDEIRKGFDLFAGGTGNVIRVVIRP